MSKQYKYVFGPVASRRLGRSLGVDLVPFKVCPFDCTYCQLGHTTEKTLARKAYVPTEEVLEEIGRRLKEVEVDCVTLAGSGEPTLHQDLGKIIQGIKALTAAPVVVITNGSLLWDPQVRRELLGADIVMPDLDAGDEETFQRINQPCAGLSFAQVVEGLRAFRREYTGKIHLEVFLVSGVNDSHSQVRKIAALAQEFQPDSIDVNTVARPPADAAAKPVPPDRLEELAKLLGPLARVIAPRPAAAGKAQFTQQDILAMVGRHPCTLEDLSAGLGADPQQVLRLVTQMVEQGQLAEKRQNGGSFFVVVSREGG
jgi:wyosine [tRNA(Phe)-imidazoG37] synthetase (radical SAM superfamily)